MRGLQFHPERGEAQVLGVWQRNNFIKIKECFLSLNILNQPKLLHDKKNTFKSADAENPC